MVICLYMYMYMNIHDYDQVRLYRTLTLEGNFLCLLFQNFIKHSHCCPVQFSLL